MEVILLEKVTKLGDLGDKVKVKAGFGRNFLIPHGKAVQATGASIAEFETRRAELQEAMTFEINRIMGDYNKEVIRTVNVMKTDDQEAVDRQTARLEKKKAETQKALEFYCGGDYIEGVNVHEELHQPAMVR